MISYPERTRPPSQNPSGDPWAIPLAETPLSTRPNSPLPTPRYPSSGYGSPVNSASSSRVALIDPNFPSPSPQTPRSSYYFHQHAGSSASTLLGSSIACPTPQLEKSITEGDDSSIYSVQKAPHANTFEKRLSAATYSIETLHKNDDVDFLPQWKRNLYRFSPLFTFLAVAAYFTYYAYRIHCTVYAQRTYHKTYIMAWLFIAAEGCVACMLSSK
jgi:hypothetical protein